MISRTFNSLPRVAQFEVAQLLGHPVLSAFLDQATKDLLVSGDLITPMVADASKCQQYVAEVQARHAQANVLLELCALAHTDFDGSTLEIA